jgi:hypothetical protein
MKSAIALLLSLGLFIAAAPLHAESGTAKSGTTSSSGKDSSNSKSKDNEKKDKESGASGAEPECN